MENDILREKPMPKHHKIKIIINEIITIVQLNDEEYADMLLVPKWLLWPKKYAAPIVFIAKLKEA